MTAPSTGMLAIYQNGIRITGSVCSIAPGVFRAGRQSVGLNPTAPAINCLYVLSEIDLISTHPDSLGARWDTRKAACYTAVGVDCGSKEHDPSRRLRRTRRETQRPYSFLSVCDVLCNGGA